MERSGKKKKKKRKMGFCNVSKLPVGLSNVILNLWELSQEDCNFVPK